jgi:ATP-binding cassette subfamily G (WHITE) protein 2
MPWRRQYSILLQRCLKEQQRRWRTTLVQLLQSLAMAALIGGVFFQIGTTQASTAKRLPVLFFCCINQGIFGAMATVNSFPAERVLTLRERAAGMYFASAYFLAKTTAESAVYVLAPTLFSCIVYWMVGLQPVASKFVVFACFMVLCQLAAVSLAQAVSAVCRDVDTSVVVLPMFLEVTRLFGGFFLAPALQKQWMVVLDYVR